MFVINQFYIYVYNLVYNQIVCLYTSHIVILSTTTCFHHIYVHYLSYIVQAYFSTLHRNISPMCNKPLFIHSFLSFNMTFYWLGKCRFCTCGHHMEYWIHDHMDNTSMKRPMSSYKITFPRTPTGVHFQKTVSLKQAYFHIFCVIHTPTLITHYLSGR